MIGCETCKEISPLNPFSYSMPTKVIFGCDRFDELAEQCQALGKRPFLVTGRQSAKRTGLLDRARVQLPEVVVFDEVDEDPGLKVCDRAALKCRDAECDVVIALGGGSPMDVSKVVSALALRSDTAAELFDDKSFQGEGLPIIAVPTTAGTGSETTPYAVIVNEEIRKKRTLRGIFPKIALVDPRLTSTLPRHITANTGLDALSQAMEGVVSRRSTPIGDTLALEACRILRRWLPAAVADGEDLEARSNVMYAAMLSGCVIAQSGTTLVHGMGYYFTVECNVPHGLANALLLTPVFQFDAKHVPEKVAMLAEALGYPCVPETDVVQDAIGEAIHMLMLECGVSPAASSAGVDKTRLAEFAKDICEDASRFRNQIGTLDAEKVQQLYEASYTGYRI